MDERTRVRTVSCDRVVELDVPCFKPGSSIQLVYGAHAELDALGQTLYPLFCVSVHEHAWMAAGYGLGLGITFGEILNVFGSSRRVCAVGVRPVGFQSLSYENNMSPDRKDNRNCEC